jgi:UDP-N-acetylmuramoylalanine--D-glutamate ligase
MAERIVILGAGESGVGAALLARVKGHDVFVSDSGSMQPVYRSELTTNGIDFEEGTHSWDRIRTATEVIKSPGIPDNAELIQRITAEGIPVISEIEFAARYTEGRVIAVTGSNGKSTTATLTHHMLRKESWDACLAGNIGRSFARELSITDHDVFVLELSSFQLDGIRAFHPHVAVLLNITPDHLDRYEKKFENYIASKFRLVMNQSASDYFIYCVDDEVITRWMDTHPVGARAIGFSIKKKLKEGAWLEPEDQLHINVHQKSMTMQAEQLALVGKHNLYNSMAAGIAARVLDLKKEAVREALMDFKGLEHRLEKTLKVGGVDFINDSKATNVNSAWYALESMTQPVIWIAGGTDKGNDYEVMKDLVRKKVKAIVCLGIDNTRVHDAFTKLVDVIVNTQSMSECVQVAYRLANPGDVVLLSPACASFDLFHNYEDRGRQFKAAVREL